ncbi:LPS O-antigen length regulator Wzz(fepE) [Enterobacter asburiae]
MKINNKQIPVFVSDALRPTSTEEVVDLIAVCKILWEAKRILFATVCCFVFIGLIVFSLLPQNWTSKAVITPAEQIQWNPLQQILVKLQVLDVDVQVSRPDVFNLFIKKFQSQSLLEEFMKNSPYVMSQLKGKDVEPQELHRAVVNISEKMKAVDNMQIKDVNRPSYTSWTLSFTAPTSNDAQTVLAGYINYISGIVDKEIMQNIRNQVALKTRMVQQQLELERVRLTSIHNINLRRLNYSLSVANAAGIKKPVYSSGQALKDDPDFSVALGADGIGQKLQIEKNLKDIAELNADFQNKEYYLAQLSKLSFEDIKIEPFNYQLSPSAPVKKDGPGTSVILLLAALLGGLLAMGGILLSNAITQRSLVNPQAKAS